MSVNSKMTAIANEIRKLSGSNEKMGLDAMANMLNTENINLTAETSSYTNELAELQTKITALEGVLEGKASGGGNSLESYTVHITSNTNDGLLNHKWAIIEYAHPELGWAQENCSINPGESINTSISVVANSRILFQTTDYDSISLNDEIVNRSYLYGNYMDDTYFIFGPIKSNTEIYISFATGGW